MRKRLLAIYDDIDRRARATTEPRSWWPCRRGCRSCCERLAAVPVLVRAEWDLLREGLDALPLETRALVAQRIEALATLEREASLPRHIVCPLLDEIEGACRVYAHRPGACRTYGFYVERGIGLHCELITDAVKARPADEEPITWGNAESIDYAFARLDGATCEEASPLTAWAASWSSGSCSPPDAPDAPPPDRDPSSPSSEM